MVECMCVRGPTLARLAMVLVWQSCGKPSTKFPHGGLVECFFIPQFSCLFFRKNSKSPSDPGAPEPAELPETSTETLWASTELRELLLSLQTLLSKGDVREKSTGVRGPTLARLAMVLVLLSIGNTPALWQRAVNRQPGSRSDNS